MFSISIVLELVRSSKALFKKKIIMENFHFLIWNSIFAFWVFVFVGFVAMDHLEAFEIVNEFFHGYNIGC